MKPAKPADTTGRRINDSYADLIVARRAQQRREWVERRYGTLGPASEVRHVEPAQYLAAQASQNNAISRRTAPNAHNSDCGTRSPPGREKRKQG